MIPSPRAAYHLYSAGIACQRRSAYEKAADYARRALAMIEPLLPEKGGESGDLIRLRALGLLGTALRHQGLYYNAEAPLLRAIEAAERMPEHPERAARVWNDLGVLCKCAGWFDRGTKAYARALEAAGRILKPLDREMIIATILHNIGGLDHARGRFKHAEEPSRRAWEIRRAHLGEEDASVLADAVAYAAVLDGLGRYAESRPIYQRALNVYERIFGPEHYETASTLHNLALLERAEGNRERAAELARRSYEIKARLLGLKHPDTALSAMNLASLDAGAARALLTDALEVFETALAPDHPHTTLCRQLMNRL